MVQQVALQEIAVLPLHTRVVAEPDFGLVPDLLAAAGYLSPVMTTAPTSLLETDLGDLTFTELSDFLPAGVASPRSASASVDPAREPSSPAVSPRTGVFASISSSVLLPSHVPIEVLPASKPRPDRGSASASGPSASSSATDPRASSPRHRRCWEYKPCQLSWEWPEHLKHVYWCMNQVNKWKAAGTDLSFIAFYGKNFRGAGASDTNLCFLYAFQAACFGLGRPGLVNSDNWKRFCDIDAFFNFLRADGVSLDYVELFKVYQKRSMWSVEEMEKVVRELP
ncbi:hypothetical protein PHYSODRAFT_309974 [Phytophthora sojae]|uniref:Uncharacterized protein n=1 Tax=Phytophthora sojae (strain P6497) TaxID=1094619 RepID=G4YN17_PHYSP|nr:hypothetical protein PHYSODRAFT_309974 [Phytophthora sojae]EGZ29812.1 hypothetical protein PHYSODRAFT_309974 [Phytophthora sojae]|eukprot:XP_009517087.1 hypothetical protein PHYSODRAFT_309974 [Phytophthora sojae]